MTFVRPTCGCTVYLRHVVFNSHVTAACISLACALHVPCYMYTNPRAWLGGRALSKPQSCPKISVFLHQASIQLCTPGVGPSMLDQLAV